MIGWIAGRAQQIRFIDNVQALIDLADAFDMFGFEVAGNQKRLGLVLFWHDVAFLMWTIGSYRSGFNGMTKDWLLEMSPCLAFWLYAFSGLKLVVD